VSSKNDLEVIMDVMVAKARRFFYTCLVRLKLEYVSCVSNPFYDVRVNRVECVQRRFIRYALRGLDWTDIHNLPPYEDRFAHLHLDTLTKRRLIACVMFIFDVLSARVNSPSLLSVLDLITPRYLTRGIEFLRIDFQPMPSVMRQFNMVIGLFYFGLTRD
jgi:hypothetical protein